MAVALVLPAMAKGAAEDPAVGEVNEVLLLADLVHPVKVMLEVTLRRSTPEPEAVVQVELVEMLVVVMFQEMVALELHRQ